METVYQYPGTDAPAIRAWRTAHRGEALWILAGIHGEEPAGPNAIAAHLQSIIELAASGVPIVVIPLCNPKAYRSNWRYPNTSERDWRKGGYSVGDAEYLLADPATGDRPRAAATSGPGHEGADRVRAASRRVLSAAAGAGPARGRTLDRRWLHLFPGEPRTDNPVGAEVIRLLRESGIPIRESGRTRFDEPIIDGVISRDDRGQPIRDGSIDELLAANEIFVDGRKASGPAAGTVIVVETPAFAGSQIRPARGGARCCRPARSGAMATQRPAARCAAGHRQPVGGREGVVLQSMCRVRPLRSLLLALPLAALSVGSLNGCSRGEISAEADGTSSPDAAGTVAASKYNPPPCKVSYEVPEPEAIVQVGHQAPVLAVLWAQQGRVLFSLAEDGSIVAWDVTGQRIIDHAQVPLPKDTRLALKPRESDSRPKEIRLNGFVGDADGSAARISYTAPGDCPLDAKKSDGGVCSFALNMATRFVGPIMDGATTEPQAPTDWFPVSPDGKWRPMPNHGNGLNGLFHPADENLTFEESDCTSRARCRYGVNLQATDATDNVIKLTGNPRNYFLDADLTADGQRLVLVESLRNDTDARVQVLELRSGARTPALSAGGPYHRARWIDGESFVLSSYGYNVTDDIEEHLRDGVAPSILVDSRCALAGNVKDCLKIPAHGLARPVGAPGRFIGTGSLNGCFESNGTGPDGVVCFDDTGNHFGMWRELQQFRPGPLRTHTGTWTRFDEPALAGHGITALEPTPDGQRVAVATVSDTPTSRTLKVLLLGQKPGDSSRVLMSRAEARAPPAEPGPMIDPRTTGEPVIEYLAFAPDGSRLLFGYKGIVTVIDPSGKEPARQFPSDAQKLAVSGDRVFGIDTGTLYDLGTGEPVADPFSVGTLIKGGFIKDKPVLWAASDDGVLHFWDSRSGTALLTFYSLPGNRFFALMPDGRYDTNLGPDTDQMRWLMSDMPWQSLGAQTFMRDYYEPRLYEKLLDCTAADNCAEVLKPVPVLAGLNRVLPVVEIAGVKAGATPGTVDISVEVHEGVAPSSESCYTDDSLGHLRPAAVHEQSTAGAGLGQAIRGRRDDRGLAPVERDESDRRRRAVHADAAAAVAARHGKDRVLRLCLQFGPREERHGHVQLRPATDTGRTSSPAGLRRDDRNRCL